MPYISDHARREDLDSAIDQMGPLLRSGDVAYVIASLIEEHLYALTGNDWDNLHFGHLALANGVLDLAKSEFQRRLVHPYEDDKADENGDVFRLPEYRAFKKRKDPIPADSRVVALNDAISGVTSGSEDYPAHRHCKDTDEVCGLDYRAGHHAICCVCKGSM